MTTEAAAGVVGAAGGAGILAIPDVNVLVALTNPSHAVDTTGLSGHQQATDWHLLNLAAFHDAVLVTLDRKVVRAVLPADAAHVMTLG